MTLQEAIEIANQEIDSKTRELLERYHFSGMMSEYNGEQIGHFIIDMMAYMFLYHYEEAVELYRIIVKHSPPESGVLLLEIKNVNFSKLSQIITE